MRPFLGNLIANHGSRECSRILVHSYYSHFYLRCSKLTSVNQTGRVIGKGQQMKILTGALIVLDLAIIGYISRQLIEMVSMLW